MATNDITGDRLHSGANTDAYRNNWDAIFGSSKPSPVVASIEESQELTAEAELLRACEVAATTFERYAQTHADRGAHSKAAENTRMARMCRRAIQRFASLTTSATN